MADIKWKNWAFRVIATFLSFIKAHRQRRRPGSEINVLHIHEAAFSDTTMANSALKVLKLVVERWQYHLSPEQIVNENALGVRRCRQRRKSRFKGVRNVKANERDKLSWHWGTATALGNGAGEISGAPGHRTVFCGLALPAGAYFAWSRHCPPRLRLHEQRQQYAAKAAKLCGRSSRQARIRAKFL